MTKPLTRNLYFELMPFIKEDTYSNQNPSKLYAKAGTEVEIIRGGHGTCIVKPINGGEQFVALDWELTDDPADCGKGRSPRDLMNDYQGPLPPKPNSSPAAPSQGSLF